MSLDDRPIFLLSIDGGGILGLLALSVLQHLEKRMQRPIHSLFDCISGVSAGGLISLGLVVPGAHPSRAVYSAAELFDVFKASAQKIFKKKIIQKIPILSTLDFLTSAQYCPKFAQKIYIELLGQHKLSQTLVQTIIPAYNIHGTVLKNPRIKVFDSLACTGEKKPDYFMHEIAMATSAVPTYFPPQRIHTIQGNKVALSDDYFIDGGVAINNPTLLAYQILRMRHPTSPIHILSLGTGKKHDIYADIKYDKSPGGLAWMNKIGHLISEPQLSVYEKILKNLRKKDLNPGAYWRIEPKLAPRLSKLDNVSSDHLDHIHQVSAAMIHHHRYVLDAIALYLSKRVISS